MTQTALPLVEREKCIGLKRDGSRCTRWARAGEDHCRQHAGLARPPAPTGLSSDDQARLFAALEDGLALDEAISVAEISRSTVYDWLAKADVEGTAPEYREFKAGVEVARVKLEQVTLRQLKAQADRGDVRAQTWLLERIRPERYGRRAVERAAGQLQIPTEPKTKPKRDDIPSNVVPIAAGGKPAW